MPIYVLRCRFCQDEAELWRHSQTAAQKALKEWRCPRCGSKHYDKVPALTSWHFGDALRSK